MHKEEFFATWSSLHGGAKIEGIVKAWLEISYNSARFLAKLKVTPNILTFAGLFFAIALWQYANSLAAALFLVLSLFLAGTLFIAYQITGLDSLPFIYLDF